MKNMGGMKAVVVVAIAALAIVLGTPALASHVPSTGQIVGHCIGWPSPHVEIRWHVNPPAGSLAPNSNSVLRGVNNTPGEWFFAGGPGVPATRINGSPAAPYGPAGYPDPNFSVYDLRDDAISPGNTYHYRVKYRPETSSNTYSVTVNAANCGNAPTPLPTPTQTATPQPTPPAGSTPLPPGAPRPTPVPAGAGTIGGVCRWVGGSPQVQLSWSQYPPPGRGAANSNSLQKGDSFPSNVNQYWGFLPSSPGAFTYTDAAVVLNTQYQYRVKYRSDLPSLNTYSIYVSAQNCGGPPPAPGPLTIAPTFQTLPPNVTGFLTATGGTGSFAWTAPTATVTGGGSQIGVTYTNASTQPVTKTVGVTSGAQSATATVQVNGIRTFQDSIDLTAPGNRRIVINDDDVFTPYYDVGLALAHGFVGIASNSVQVRLSNTLEEVAGAPLQPYLESIPWNICDSPGYCNEGPYTVYAIYTAPGGITSPVVLDNILYVQPTVFPPASVVINDGDATTDDRLVALSLDHGFISIPVDEIGMQISNRADFLDADGNPSAIVAFTPAVSGWDVCAGLGATCVSGTKTVYVRYCARGTCSVVTDAILYSTVTPTPTPIISVTPTLSPIPTASVAPMPTNAQGPSRTPGVPPLPTAGSVTPCSGISCIFDGIGEAFSGAEPVIGPLALVSALVVALSALITLLPLIGPGLISFAWQWLMGAMGILPARKKTWGTVYDSATKRPIAYAKVQLLDRNRRVLETRVADKDGRYGFLTTPESLQAQNTQIYILPTAVGYVFPSRASVTIDLFVYRNLYRGDLITVEDSSLINFDVPLDPLQQKTTKMTTAPSIALGAAVALMADAGFWLGLIIVPINFLVSPNPFTFGTLCLFLGTASLRLFGISEHPFGTITDAQTGSAMPFALLTLNDLTGKRVAFAVSDEQGRYFMVVERGNYELTVFTPSTIQPTRQIKQAIEVKKGWVTRSIRI